jgi:hypothetical protein
LHGDEKESVTKRVIEEDKKTYESSKVDQKYVDHNMFLEGREIKARKVSPKGEESFAPPKDAKKEKDTNMAMSTVGKWYRSPMVGD